MGVKKTWNLRLKNRLQIWNFVTEKSVTNGNEKDLKFATEKSVTNLEFCDWKIGRKRELKKSWSLWPKNRSQMGMKKTWNLRLKNRLQIWNFAIKKWVANLITFTFKTSWNLWPKNRSQIKTHNFAEQKPFCDRFWDKKIGHKFKHLNAKFPRSDSFCIILSSLSL